MVCPDCQHEFPLTWARYLRSPAGRHACPHCGQPSRLRISARYLLQIIMAESLGAIAGGFIFHWWHSGFWFAFGCFLGALLIGIPADRFLDDQCRPLGKIPAPRAT